MYQQRWHALQQARICSAAPTFELLPGLALDLAARGRGSDDALRT